MSTSAWILILLIIPVPTPAFNVQLVSAVKKYLGSSCVFLLGSPGLEEHLLLKQFEETLGLSTATVYWQELQKEFPRLSCQSSRPLLVAPSVSGSAQQYVAQLSLNASLSRASWLLLLEGSAAEVFLAAVDVPFDCRLLVATTSRDGVILTEAFRVARSLPLQLVPVGYWSPSTGLRADRRGLYLRRTALHDLVLKGTTLSNVPATSVVEKEGIVVDVEGYFGHLWFTLQERLNFTTQLTRPPDNSWGSRSSVGWSGMMGQVVRGEVDVAISDIYMMPERVEAMDFLAPLLITRTSVYIRHLDAPASRWDRFATPFRSSLWLAVGALLLVSGLYLHWVEQQGRRSLGNESRVRLADSLLFVTAACCLQGQGIGSSCAASRLVQWVHSLCAVVLLTAFCSQLMACLATQQPELPFSDFRGMLEDGSYRLGVLDHSSMLEVFEKSKDDVMSGVFKRMIAPELHALPRSIGSGFERVCARERYSFINTVLIAQVLQANLNCTLWPVPGTSFPSSLGILVHKHSPYRGILNHVIQQLRRSGALRNLYLRSWPDVDQFEDTFLKSVGLKEVIPVCVVVLAALVCCITFVLLERVMWFQTAKMQNRFMTF